MFSFETLTRKLRLSLKTKFEGKSSSILCPGMVNLIIGYLYLENNVLYWISDYYQNKISTVNL